MERTSLTIASGVVDRVLARGTFDPSQVPAMNDGASRRLKRVDLGGPNSRRQT